MSAVAGMPARELSDGTVGKKSGFGNQVGLLRHSVVADGIEGIRVGEAVVEDSEAGAQYGFGGFAGVPIDTPGDARAAATNRRNRECWSASHSGDRS